jgi:YD repeat-containing protein
VLWMYKYDAADQLVVANKHDTTSQQAIVNRYAYAYDPAGNRTAEQIDDAVIGATHDNLNRLLTHQPAGGLQFAGTVNEPAVVTVRVRRATVTGDNAFRATVAVTSGTNVIMVTATDPSGDTATREYEVDNLGTPKTFRYDANGNLTADGPRTFKYYAHLKAEGETFIPFTSDCHNLTQDCLSKWGLKPPPNALEQGSVALDGGVDAGRWIWDREVPQQGWVRVR